MSNGPLTLRAAAADQASFDAYMVTVGSVSDALGDLAKHIDLIGAEPLPSKPLTESEKAVHNALARQANNASYAPTCE